MRPKCHIGMEITYYSADMDRPRIIYPMGITPAIRCDVIKVKIFPTRHEYKTMTVDKFNMFLELVGRVHSVTIINRTEDAMNIRAASISATMCSFRGCVITCLPPRAQTLRVDTVYSTVVIPRGLRYMRITRYMGHALDFRGSRVEECIIDDAPALTHCAYVPREMTTLKLRCAPKLTVVDFLPDSQMRVLYLDNEPRINYVPRGVVKLHGAMTPTVCTEGTTPAHSWPAGLRQFSGTTNMYPLPPLRTLCVDKINCDHLPQSLVELYVDTLTGHTLLTNLRILSLSSGQPPCDVLQLHEFYGQEKLCNELFLHWAPRCTVAKIIDKPCPIFVRNGREVVLYGSCDYRPRRRFPTLAHLAAAKCHDPPKHMHSLVREHLLPLCKCNAAGTYLRYTRRAEVRKWCWECGVCRKKRISQRELCIV